MSEPITPAEAGSRILQHAAEGRLIQGSFHRVSEDGRGLACMLGSLGPHVAVAQDCPASVMPGWLALVVVQLFDGQAEAEALNWAVRFGAQMQHPGWAGMDWDAVRDEWLSGVVAEALEAARPVAQSLPCWPQVEAASRQVIAVLRGDGELPAARADAYAAVAAARAAYAAAVAADAAAYAVARAAYAAAVAADAAAYAVARAAAADATAKQAASLCDIIGRRLGEVQP